jgi:5-methylcytosine-specific restriction endonuclease McrA
MLIVANMARTIMERPHQLVLFDTAGIHAANDTVYQIRRRPTHRESRSHNWRSPEWQRTRNLVLERDQYACHICQRQLPDAVRLEVHHWVPVRVAPLLWKSPSNLATLCVDCHRTQTWKQALHYGWRYVP